MLSASAFQDFPKCTVVRFQAYYKESCYKAIRVRKYYRSNQLCALLRSRAYVLDGLRMVAFSPIPIQIKCCGLICTLLNLILDARLKHSDPTFFYTELQVNEQKTVE